MPVLQSCGVFGSQAWHHVSSVTRTRKLNKGLQWQTRYRSEYNVSCRASRDDHKAEELSARMDSYHRDGNNTQLDLGEASLPARSNRPLDDVDRFLMGVGDFFRNPVPYVLRLGYFMIDSLRLTRYLYTPPIRVTVLRSFVVLLVVAVFCGLIYGIDACFALLMTVYKT